MAVPYLDDIPLRLMHLRLECRTPWAAKGDWAADLRGAIGKAVHGSEAWGLLFSPTLTDRAPRGLGGGSGAPRPFVLWGPSPRALPQAGFAEATLVLLGRSAAEVEAWTRIARRAFADGFGDPRGSFRVRGRTLGRDRTVGAWSRRRVDELLGDAPGGLLQVSTKTPVWLMSKGELLLPSPPALADGVLRRAQAQGLLHGLAASERDWSGLMERARRIELQAGFQEHWSERGGARYSHRQRRRVPLSGLAGWWRGVLDRELAELFAAGEVLHAGKATTSGMGRVALSAPLEPPEALLPE